MVLSFFLMVAALFGVRNAGAAGFVGTQTCIDCHSTWQDNNPPVEDVLSGDTSVDYLPVNLSLTRSGNPFYTIPEGFVSSLHYTPPSALTAKDFVSCENCHGTGLAHFGVGSIPVPIPQAKTCINCHNETQEFPRQDFLLTAHANQNREPGKYFDQRRNGLRQAKTTFNTPASVSLFKSDQSTIVSKNERIEECSVCHNYALQYPQFRKKIAQGNFPNPQVSCGACHDSHIVGPNGNQPAIVSSTVKVTGISGSNVTAVTPVEGRKIFYVNNKPYKINDDGAQDTKNGIWTRGSAFNRPQPVIIQGIGTVGNSSNGVADTFKFTTGGFLGNVRSGDTLFISGKASATVPLPADALNAGAPVTVEATFDKAGFFVGTIESNENFVVGTFDQNLILDTREDPARDQLIAQLGTDKIGIVAKAPVTYKKATGTGTLNVFVPFNGTVNFEIRDMRTNTENLCGSCHTRGKFKFSVFGKKRDGTFADVSDTHNEDILTQYRSTGFFPPGPGQESIKGHAGRFNTPFIEFSSFEYGSSHQPTFPFDMSITGSGGLNSLRNKGNTSFNLTQTPDPANVFLGASNLINQVVLINNYACNQCHHGLGSVDYMMDRQGTSSAQVLWGDATVVCITCHDPHTSPIEKNVRVPVKLSYNSAFADPVKNPRGGKDTFMDGTDIPSQVGIGKVCLFCHQGRESGLTVFLAIKAKGVDPYATPDKVIGGLGFVNPHYYDSGALLWSKNAWEFLGQTYSKGVPEHQNRNCMDCHMTPASVDPTTGVTVGGHTWRPDIATCQLCHVDASGNPVQAIRRVLPDRGTGVPNTFINVPASADYDGDGVVKTAFEEIGTINDLDFGDSGLFGQLKAALQGKGIFYDPDTYPYFFSDAALTKTFSGFTSNTMAAAFNLSWAWKAGTCVYYHNAPYVVQILQDSLVALGVPLGARKRPPPPATDSRPATDYRTIVVNP